MFEGNFYSFLKFEEENLYFKPSAYYNFNEASIQKLNVSHFEVDLKMINTQNNLFFGFVKNNNVLNLFSNSSNKDIQWLFNIKKSLFKTKNNVIRMRKNGFLFDDFFFETSLEINFKELISDKILDIKMVNREGLL